LTKKCPAEIGILGENLVAQWLQGQGWQIIAQRWRCQHGEIDLIALRGDSLLTFVEVKTRNPHNWDADGLLAISASKQIRLWQAAQLFLATHPELDNFLYRFDVALVRYQPQGDRLLPADRLPIDEKIVLGQAIALNGYQLSLQAYMESAFDSIEA
jgi:putative endonuclease